MTPEIYLTEITNVGGRKSGRVILTFVLQKKVASFSFRQRIKVED